MNAIRILSFVAIILFTSAYLYYQKNESSVENSQREEFFTTLRGKLRLKSFPRSSEYSTFEMGDRADVNWIVELDSSSFLIALNTPESELSLDLCDILNRKEPYDLTLNLDDTLEGLCKNYKDQDVIVRGELFHAHTTHHHTPLLMSLKEILPVR